jgi:hypothetical protein
MTLNTEPREKMRGIKTNKRRNEERGLVRHKQSRNKRDNNSIQHNKMRTQRATEEIL